MKLNRQHDSFYVWIMFCSELNLCNNEKKIVVREWGTTHNNRRDNMIFIDKFIEIVISIVDNKKVDFRDN